MPYRRLPTTDAARMRALRAAATKAETTGLNRLAYSPQYIHPVRNLIQRLEGAQHEQSQARSNLIRLNRDFQPILVKTRLYVSHFIQVLNLAIQRGEIPAEARAFYSLPGDENRLPSLRTEQEILEWGGKIVEGENARIKTGGVPVMNPNIARVKVWYDQFKDSYHFQITASRSAKRANQKLLELRAEIDGVIRNVWDEVEKYFQEEPGEEERDRAVEYGVVYVLRKDEKKAG
ncbi:MAG: hypothetical protein R6V75_07905 [Bacteroidales bacterium]